ncbi:MAG: hypothetical protein ING69_10585 [Rhodocyclaceae bacterium]|nr:hypothetical protein [Rhodocyclaceae bacterium]
MTATFTVYDSQDEDVFRDGLTRDEAQIECDDRNRGSRGGDHYRIVSDEDFQLMKNLHEKGQDYWLTTDSSSLSHVKPPVVWWADRRPVVVITSFRGRTQVEASENGFAAFKLGENDPYRFEILDESDLENFPGAREIFDKHGAVIVLDKHHSVEFFAPNDLDAPTYEELYLNACAGGEAHRRELSVKIIRTSEEALEFLGSHDAEIDALRYRKEFYSAEQRHNAEAIDACLKLGFLNAAEIAEHNANVIAKEARSISI